MARPSSASSLPPALALRSTDGDRAAHRRVPPASRQELRLLRQELYTHLVTTTLVSQAERRHLCREPISPSVLRLMRDELGIAVLSVYQTVELGIVGWECERQCGHHLNVDLCPIRILDDNRRQVPVGESGEVVGSNLVNRGTMLLNYLVGDLAGRLPEPCGCGRALPLLSSVQGRSTDWLRSASGRPIHPQAVRGILSPLGEIRRYQLVQERPGHVRVVAVTMPETDRDQLRTRIVGEARHSRTRSTPRSSSPRPWRGRRAARSAQSWEQGGDSQTERMPYVHGFQHPESSTPTGRRGTVTSQSRPPASPGGARNLGWEDVWRIPRVGGSRSS